MIDWYTCPAVERAPDRVSGAWVFRGTRVPVRTLFENLQDGASLDDSLEWFPGVTRTQAGAVLRMCAESLDDASDGRIALERHTRRGGSRCRHSALWSWRRPRQTGHRRASWRGPRLVS